MMNMPPLARKETAHFKELAGGGPKTTGQSQASEAPGMSFEQGMKQHAPSAGGLKRQKTLRLSPPGGKKGKGKEGNADSKSELAPEQAQEGNGKEGNAGSKSEKAMELAQVVGGSAQTYDSWAKLSEEWTEGVKADKEGAPGLGASLEGASAEAQAWSAFGDVVNVGSVIAAALTVKDKYKKWREFQKTERLTRGDKKEVKLHTVVVFAAKKAGRAFINASIKIADATLDLVSQILTLAGAAAAGVVLKAISLAGNALQSIYKAADGAWEKWQEFKGRKSKRSQNTDQLLKLAAGDDKEAARLLLNLDLTFVVGGKLHDAKRKVSGSEVGGTFLKEAESVSDAAGRQFDSESAPEDLCEALKDLQADAKTNEAAKASLDSLRKELESAMSSQV